MRKDRHKKPHHRQHKGGDGKRSTKSDHRETENRKDSVPLKPRVDSVKPDDNSSQQVDTDTLARSTFSRRKVESNWDRYQELPDVEDHTEPRGTDFTTLLNQAGAASTQFRLHDEKDWDDETERFQLTGNVLSLDMNALSMALMQVPVHTRLQIEPDIFQVGQPDAKFDQITLQDNLSAARTTCPSELPTATQETGEIIKNIAPHSDKLSDNFGQDSEKVTVLIPKSTELAEKQKERLKAEIGKTVKSDAAAQVKETVNVAIEYDEDELEFLLSLDTLQSEQTTDPQTEIQSLPVEEQDQQEHLTNEETKDSINSSKIPEQTAVSEPTPDELEDWLDSVLDD